MSLNVSIRNATQTDICHLAGVSTGVSVPRSKIELGLIFEELLAYRIEPDGEPVLAAPSAGGAFLGVDSLPLKLTAR